MSQALSFNDVSLVPVPVTNSPFTWLRSADIARALGYKRVDILSKLYNNNADEFTPEMTQVIEIVAEHQNGVVENLSDGRCRVFSLRGCHLLAMFSRTPVAKAFRKWVLDVLDRLAEEEQAALPHGYTLTATEQAQLQAIVQAKAGMVPADMQRKAFAEMWTRFNRHFRIARYAQLPPAKMGEAVEYLVGMEVKAAVAALPAAKERKTHPHYRSHAEVKASLGAIQNTLITNANILLSSLEDINSQVRKAFHNPERRGDLATHADKVLDNFKSVLVRSRQSFEDQLNVCNDTLNGLIGLARILEYPKQSGEPIIYGLRSF